MGAREQSLFPQEITFIPYKAYLPHELKNLEPPLPSYIYLGCKTIIYTEQRTSEKNKKKGKSEKKTLISAEYILYLKIVPSSFENNFFPKKVFGIKYQKG